MGKRSFFVCLLACGQIFSFLYSKVRKSTVQYRYLFGASIQYNTIHYNTLHYKILNLFFAKILNLLHGGLQNRRGLFGKDAKNDPSVIGRSLVEWTSVFETSVYLFIYLF